MGSDNSETTSQPINSTQSVGQSKSQEPGSLSLEFEGRKYHARWAQLGTVESLRVNVRIESGAGDEQKIHVETLDLYSPRSRRVFAVKAARIFSVSVDAIDDDLSKVLVAVDKVQRENAKTKIVSAEETKTPILSEHERKEAITYLQGKELMERICADMAALGYVGEDANKKLGYLVAVSRKLSDPLSAIIISQSGAGKSGLASALERLVPTEDVVFWSRLTPQALYYVDQDFLKCKLVIIEEREGSEAADYSIRALQSKKRLVQAVPVKDPTTGTIRTRTMEVEGPAAFLETTTRLHINPENATRCFELYLDESPAQTERVHQAQRMSKTVDGILQRKKTVYLEKLHQNIQRCLQPIEVAIPFADLMTFPPAWIRTRRDNLRLMNLIEAIAFLHQCQRPQKQFPGGEIYIEATVEDYAIAYSLAADVLNCGFDELRKPVRDLLAVIEGKLKAISTLRNIPVLEINFIRRDVRTWSGLPNHQVKALMRELDELEYVSVEKSQRGSRYTYRLIELDKRPKPMAGLLTPVELYNRIQEANAAKLATEKTKSGKK